MPPSSLYSIHLSPFTMCQQLRTTILSDTNPVIRNPPPFAFGGKKFKSMVPESPREKLDVVNSKQFQDEALRYIEIDIRVDQNEGSRSIFEMLAGLPSFVKYPYVWHYHIYPVMCAQ